MVIVFFYPNNLSECVENENENYLNAKLNTHLKMKKHGKTVPMYAL